MRRALLVCAAIVFAIACGDDITEPTPNGTVAAPPSVAFATTTTEDGLSISTDKDDYQPGDVVHFTGYGWQAGDVLDIVLTDDPLTHDPHTWTVEVGADGMFHDQTYVVDEGDLNVAFTLVATSRATGRSLTVNFTDSQPTSVTLSPTSQLVTPGNSAVYQVTVAMGGNTNACTVTLSVPTTLPTGATAAITGGANPFTTTNDDFTRTLTISTTSGTPASTTVFTVQTAKGSDCQNGAAPSTTGTLNVLGPASKLAFAQQPSSAVSTTPITPAVTVQVLDAANNVVTGSSAPITLDFGNNAGSGTLSGTLTQNAVSGVATFSGISIDKIGTGYTLAASSGTLAGATSNPFNITLGNVNKLAFTTQPIGGAPNTAFTSQPVVRVQDAGGNTITVNPGMNANITLSIVPGTGTAGAVLTCTGSNSRGASNGVATFSGCQINLAGTGYRLRANTTINLSPGSLALSVDSDLFNVVSDIAATTLTADPATGTYGGQVDLSATLKTGATTPVVGRSIAFTLNGNSVGSATTNSSGVATLNNVFLTSDGTAGGTRIPAGGLTNRVGASFVGDASFSSSLGSAALTVNQKSVTPSITAEDKEYDGNTSATIATRTLTGVLAGDVVNLVGGTATFANKDIGLGKTVTATGLSLDGAQAGNYVLSTTTATTTASITQITLTGHFTAQSREYNGNTAAFILTRTLTGNIITGDDVSLTGGTATFDDKNAGNGKTVTGVAFALSGTDKGNYELASSTLSTTADITERPITVTAKTDTKEYDGDTSSDETPEITGSIATGDAATFSQVFDTKNAGTNKTLTPSGSVNDGNSGKNYKVTFVNNSTGAITPRALALTAHGVNKIYDGNTSASVTFTDDRVSGDLFTIGYTAIFADKNVGTGKIVSVTGINLTGTDADNYTPNTTASTNADISRRTLTVVASAADKYYDGNTTATVTLSFGQPYPPLAGDNVTVSYVNANFSDKEVGSSKTVTVTGLTTGGTDGGNYDPNPPTHEAITSANILKWTIAGFFQPVDMSAGGNMWNTTKGGYTVPLKFKVFAGSVEKTDVAVIKSFVQTKLVCPDVATSDEIEIVSTGGTTLRYDASGGQFIQNWQTPKPANTCYKATMTTLDGSSITALFKTK
jgi:hypothetical protein